MFENFTDMDMELSFDYSKDCSVSLCGNTSLAPGESTELSLCPQMGLPVGEHDLGVTVTAKTATGETITKKIWDSFRVDSRTFQGLVDTIEPVTGITNGVEKLLMLYICHRFLKSMVLKWMEKNDIFCRCKMGCGELCI